MKRTARHSEVTRSTLIAFLAVVSLARTAEAQGAKEPLERIRVACIGNSITYGDGIQDRERNSYPAQLQGMLGARWWVRNFGVSGATLLDKGDHPYRDCPEFAEAKAFNPDLVIIKLGTNDTKPQNWRLWNEFENNYLRFIDEFRSLPAHPRIFLCTPVPAYQEKWGIRDSVIRDGVIPLVRKIAGERNLRAIDLYPALAGMGALFPDAIHPNAEGAGVMARTIRESICPECPPTTPPVPYGPLPSDRQMRWQDLEFCAFIHFNMNTFTGREWGDGTEDPKEFNPAQLDCRQWVRVCKAAGMKGIVLTAKHHDGFCLWPSRFTEHSISSSPFRNGKGDILRDLSEACREAGLKFGVYLSPWDRHEASYGDSPGYNQFYENQLREILTSYGDVFEVWFDGACGEGPNGRKQVYDWPAFFAVVRKCQPQAVIFSDGGPDVRWVGDEDGFAGETNWSLLRSGEVYPGYPRYTELAVGHPDGNTWVPAECDVSIRPGWFYHPSQDDSVKSLGTLIDIYFGSIGRNASLLLNIPVDRRGLIADADAKRLMEFRALVTAMFALNFAKGGTATASATRGGDRRFSPQNAIDGDPSTYWTTDDTIRESSLTVALARRQRLNCVLLEEYLPLGQRVEQFSVEIGGGATWSTICQGTTIGHKRLLRFAPAEADSVRLVIEKSRACPVIGEIGLFMLPPIPSDGHTQ